MTTMITSSTYDKTLLYAELLPRRCRSSLPGQGLQFAAQQKETWWWEGLFCRRAERGPPHSRATADTRRVAENPAHITSRHMVESLPKDKSPVRTPSLLPSRHCVVCLHLRKAGHATAMKSRFVRPPLKLWQTLAKWRNMSNTWPRFRMVCFIKEK